LLVRDTRTKAGELSYKEIATEMSVGHRTVDGYREAIFQKLDIHTRIGLVMYAVKNGIVEV
jgi:DNA-binding NarL/FixJ family response regulator